MRKRFLVNDAGELPVIAYSGLPLSCYARPNGPLVQVGYSDKVPGITVAA